MTHEAPPLQVERTPSLTGGAWQALNDMRSGHHHCCMREHASSISSKHDRNTHAVAPRTSFIAAGCLWRPAKATHEGQLLSSHVQHLEKISILQAVALVLLPTHDSDAILCVKAAQAPHKPFTKCCHGFLQCQCTKDNLGTWRWLHLSWSNAMIAGGCSKYTTQMCHQLQHLRAIPYVHDMLVAKHSAA